MAVYYQEAALALTLARAMSSLQSTDLSSFGLQISEETFGGRPLEPAQAAVSLE